VQARIATALQARDVAARVAAALHCCCNMCRDNAAALLQHVSRQHCCSSRCCGTIAAGAATTLRRCFSSRRIAAMAGRATLAGGQRRNFCFFLFFLLESFKERTRARQREKRQGFETCFPALLVGLNVTQKLPLAATVVATCAPSGSNNTTPVVTTQELQKCKKSVAFNMKQQEIEFF